MRLERTKNKAFLCSFPGGNGAKNKNLKYLLV